MPTSLHALADAAEMMMKNLRLNGQFTVSLGRGGGTQTGWVGEPGGDDVEIVVTVNLLPPIKPKG